MLDACMGSAVADVDVLRYIRRAVKGRRQPSDHDEINVVFRELLEDRLEAGRDHSAFRVRFRLFSASV